YNKVLKSNNLEYKYGKAVEYYKDGQCIKALPLFEELIALYRGTAKSEKIFYYYAQTHYCLKDYILAGYYFKQFGKTFPNSQFVEECTFLSAYCNYLESPGYSLDSGPTQTALNELQLYLELFPNTELKDSVNTLMDELNIKLERKAFENSKLYLRTERYKSAVIALQNVLKDYPATDFREEVMFMIIEANYKLAINSIESKKRERLEDTIDSYHKFVDNFENSTNLSKAEQYYLNARKELEVYN
ncbi:MAG: outer membrane protein assembly factor BamD, partial [Bacteroidota bacterium]